MKTIAFVLTLSFLLAGCSSAKPEANSALDEEEPAAERTEVAPGVTTAVNKGVVQGAVLSENGLAIQAARVSVLGQNAFTDTDATGRYVLKDLSPGKRTIQVQAKAFLTAEKEVEVVAATATNLTFELKEDPAFYGGTRPHVHDLWQGRVQHVLADFNWDLTKGSNLRQGESQVPDEIPAMFMDPNTNTTEYKIPIPDIAGNAPNLVFPGATRIEVTFKWTQTDTTKTKLGLGYSSLRNVPRVYTGVESSGHTWTIDINQTQTDTGHQMFTYWNFIMFYGRAVTSGTAGEPAVTLGKVHVKIVVHKGDVIPLEAAHEDHWGNATTLLLRNGTPEFSYGGTSTNRETFEMTLDSKSIVPPGTATLRFNLSWTFTNAVMDAINRDYKLMWRSADQNPRSTTWEQYQTENPSSKGVRWKQYEISVKPQQWDSYYQTVSNWAWTAVEPGRERDQFDQGVQNRDRVFKLEVVAIKDPKFGVS
jgi:hypothetical protein